MDFPVILGLTVSSAVFAHTLNFAFLSMYIDCIPPVNKAAWYQIYALVYSAAALVYSSIGNLLAGAIGPTGVFIVIACVLLLNFPILLKIDIAKFRAVCSNQTIFKGRLTPDRENI